MQVNMPLPESGPTGRLGINLTVSGPTETQQGVIFYEQAPRAVRLHNRSERSLTRLVHGRPRNPK